MTPEQHLGVAIVERAVMDLSAPEDDIRADAREWFLGSTTTRRRDRDFWFDALGFDVDYCLHKLRPLLDRAESKPVLVSRKEQFFAMLPDRPFRVRDLSKSGPERDRFHSYVGMLLAEGRLRRIAKGLYQVVFESVLAAA